MSEIITSKQNNKVKALVKLRQKKLLREQIGQFLIEGYKEVTEAHAAGVKIVELYYCRQFFREESFNDLVKAIDGSGAAIQEVSADVFTKVSHREGPDGLLAIGETFVKQFSDITLSENPLIMIVEAVEKPGNLGNVIRSAEAAGVDLLAVCDPVCDVFNPNVVRASLGMVFSLPVVNCTSEQAFRFLSENKIVPIAMTPHTETMYWDLDMTGPTAILVGSEFQGLSSFWMDNALTRHAKLPLNGQGDSLNAATASTLALYEALRQRR